MATTSYSVQLSIEDTLFGKDIQFNKKQIEVWLVESTYEELISTTYTDHHANAAVHFELTYEGEESGGVSSSSSSGSGVQTQQPTIRLKVLDGDVLIPYTFEINDLEMVSLNEGANQLVVLVDLADQYVGVTNELLRGKGVLLSIAEEAVTVSSSSSAGTEIPGSESKPYPDISVTTSIWLGETEVRSLGTTVTNRLGLFTFSFVKDKELTAQLKYNYKSLSFKFEFSKFGQSVGDPAFRTYLEICDFDDLVVIETTLTIPSGITTIDISEISATLKFPVEDQVQNFLSTYDPPLITLRDLRAVGGLKRIAPAELASTFGNTIAKLDAHAQLETLSKNYKANQHVVDQGYTSVYKVAKATRKNFLNDVVELGILNHFNAFLMHRVANVHRRIYSTVGAELLVKRKYQNQ